MALAFKARDHTTNADVVIKVPKVKTFEEEVFLKRFSKENQALQELNHPNIVSILHVGEHEEWPFTVLHFLTGGDLDARRKALGGKLSLFEISSWASVIAETLDFIHSQDYIHRDVKPSNILFDWENTAFLSDFGIAKLLSTDSSGASTNLTSTGMLLGTPNYMAPELIMGEDIDGRVDQYALAATIYHCLAGQPPFQAASIPAVLVKQTNETPLPLTELDSTIPENVSAHLMKALSKDPDQRFPTCKAFVDQLLQSIEASPTHPMLPTQDYAKETTKPAPKETEVVPSPLAETHPNKKPSMEGNAAQLRYQRNLRFGIGIGAVCIGVALGVFAFLKNTTPKTKLANNAAESPQKIGSQQQLTPKPPSVTSPQIPDRSHNSLSKSASVQNVPPDPKPKTPPRNQAQTNDVKQPEVKTGTGQNQQSPIPAHNETPQKAVDATKEAVKSAKEATKEAVYEKNVKESAKEAVDEKLPTPNKTPSNLGQQTPPQKQDAKSETGSQQNIARQGSQGKDRKARISPRWRNYSDQPNSRCKRTPKSPPLSRKP